MTRVLIVGLPRSGTTWTGRVLGHCAGAAYVNEPDGDHDPFAFRARLGHLAEPTMHPDSEDRDLERLWQGAFSGGGRPRSPRARAARWIYAKTPVDERWRAWLTGRVSPRLRLAAALSVPLTARTDVRDVVVKSVRAELSIEWIAARFSPRVLVVERNPLNVLASWNELGFVNDVRESLGVSGYAGARWGVTHPDPVADRLEHQAFLYGVLATALREAAAGHPEWSRVTHEHLCTDSVARFQALAQSLGLTWSDAARDFVTASDREGSGYDTHRRTGEQPDRWRERLDDAQVRTIREVLARFPGDLVAATGA